MTLAHNEGAHAPRWASNRTALAYAIACLLPLLVLGFRDATAATVYVDINHPSCSDANPGTEALPYCSINGAMRANDSETLEVLVAPGEYAERVTVRRPRTALKARGPGVTVRGGIGASARPGTMIDGFTVISTGGTAISVGQSEGSIVSNNTVFGSGTASAYGIYVAYTSDVHVLGNTVTNPGQHAFVIRIVDRVLLEDNVAFGSETGFLLKSGNDVKLRRNRSHGNTHTGFYYRGAHRTESVQNQSWNNGLYGFNMSTSSGSFQNGDVAWNNGNDGFTVRGVGTALYNCIAVDNGGTGDHNLYVDTFSMNDVVLDDNIFWSSTGEPPIKFGDVEYAHMGDFVRATGKGARTDLVDPMLLNPPAGDFRLVQGSPAIDAANTEAHTGWPGADATGRVPFDDPGAFNAGFGPIAHADRGAFEFVPTGSNPVAALSVRPAFETPTRQFIVDASASVDAEGPILFYRFDFGDGTQLGPVVDAIVPHIYAGGTWTTTVTAIDADGMIGSASFEVVTDAATPARIYFVDGSSPACNDSLPGVSGSADVPFCSIAAAYKSYNGPGVTLRVKPGVYDEDLQISEDGAPNDPFVLQADGPGVVMNGRIWASARHFVTVDGFEVSQIYVGSSDGWVVTDNVAGRIDLAYSGAHHVAGNTAWAYDIRRVVDSVFEDNVSTGGEHGFHFKEGAYGNVVRRNRASGAVKNGFYFENSGNNLVVQNLAWNNGEHGVHGKRAAYNRYIGNVVWGSGEDGISLRGESIGTKAHNNIFANNGLLGSAPDFYADSVAALGIEMNDNIIWTPADKKPITFGTASYQTLAEFAAVTGQGTRSVQANPMFIDPANGDFRLIQGSPAIDNANSSLAEWPGTDILGVAPFDDPDSPNAGLGPIAFADRGAYEFAPSGSAPVASLRITPATELPALEFDVDASASFDVDGPFLRYAFDFGDGTQLGPQAEAAVRHTYPPGTWTTVVTVIDGSGLVGIASVVLDTDAVTPVIASFVRAAVAPTEVALTWHVSALEDGEVTVQRIAPRGAWRSVAVSAPDAAGFVNYRDADIRSGERYGYRLGIVSDGTPRYFAEAWVDVPAAFQLAIEGVRPDPSGLDVGFQLPRRGTAELRLVDVAGRRLAERRLDGLGAGSHRARFETRALPSGVYWVTLRHDGQTITRKTAVVR